MREFEDGFGCTAITTEHKLVDIIVPLDEMRSIIETGREARQRRLRWLYQFYPTNRPYYFICEAILGPYIIDPKGYAEYVRGEN